MSYEQRIFVPLPAGQVAASASAAAAASSSSAAPSPAPAAAAAKVFSLFDASDFRTFHPTDAVPSAVQRPEVRTDLYLFDDTIPNMASYGLKLRGTAGESTASSGGADAEQSYELELKIRTSADGSDDPSGASSSARLRLPEPENWKKVVKKTPIKCTRDGLAAAILPVLQFALTSEEGHKKRVALLQPLVAALQERKEQGWTKLRMVEVSKRRVQLPKYGAEQTDVDVRLKAVTGAEMPSAGGGATAHYRSICFEGDKKKLHDTHVNALFEHLLATCPGAMVASYPAFLLHVLHTQLSHQRGARSRSSSISN